MASAPTAPSVAASSSIPKPASSSISKATRSPINEGTLCPKGSNALLLALNPHRMKSVLYRAPYSDKWETKTLDWALDQIAQRVKAARDADFTVRDEQGRTLNSVRNMGSLGGASLNIEDNYLIKKLLCGGLGVVSVENQART